MAERIGNGRKRTDDADATASVENRLDGSSKRLHINAERYAGKLLTECSCDLGDRIDRIKDVDDNGQFRLQAGSHALRAGLQQVDPGNDRPRIRQKNHAGWREDGIASGTIEQRDADLVFKIADSLADNGLRPKQFPGRSR